jgi:hypothetical protein
VAHTALAAAPQLAQVQALPLALLGQLLLVGLLSPQALLVMLQLAAAAAPVCGEGTSAVPAAWVRLVAAAAAAALQA